MKRRFLCVAAAGLLVACLGSARADESALDLMKRVQDAAPKTPLQAKGKLTSDRGQVRELQLSRKRVNDDVDASYMEVTAPMDLKDTRFLFFDHKTGRDEQFIYVPAAKRAIQVGGQTRKQSFLGSEFYVGDFARPEVDAFTYTFVGDENVGGRQCKLVQAVPKKPDDALYSKSIMAIDPNDLVVMRTQLYDDKGQLLKVWTIEKLDKIDGTWTPVKQKIEDVQEHHWSELEMTDIKYNTQLPDDIFNKSYLTR
jgi:Outer membrane lipoprotein-sorting protein